MNSPRLIPVPALTGITDNYIWLLTDSSGRALIVDPGDAAPVLDVLHKERLAPAAILLTHHHPDHVDGVAGLLERYAGLDVIAPHDARITTATRRVAEGEKVHFAAPQAAFEVIAIPGHTLTHIAYFGAGILFAGDTLFSVGCGRLFEGSPAQMLASLDRLAALPGTTLLCCGHEYTLTNCAFALSVDGSNIDLLERTAEVKTLRARGAATLPVILARELATNPFLRVDVPAVRDSCTQALGMEAARDRVARFAWLRREKDGFRALP